MGKHFIVFGYEGQKVDPYSTLYSFVELAFFCQREAGAYELVPSLEDLLSTAEPIILSHRSNQAKDLGILVLRCQLPLAEPKNKPVWVSRGEKLSRSVQESPRRSE